MSNQRALFLPFKFDEQRLLDDLTICMQHSWPKHFNQKDFAGDWSSIALRSASGDINDIHAHPDSEYIDTALLEQCTYFKEVISTFKCPLEAVRLLHLAPGSIIKEHCDIGTAYADGVLRIHVPVTTNPKVSFIVGGESLRMLPGECWYADFSLPHCVRNDGTSSRVHLVIDALRNDWTDEIFESTGYDFDAERKAKAPLKAVRERMIEELTHQDSPGARMLLQKLLAEDEHHS